MSRLHVIAASVAIVFSFAHAIQPLHAQALSPPDVQTSSMLAHMRASIIRAIGAEDQTVEITMAGNILIVLRVNSNMNESTHGGRDNEATAIASVVSNAISGKSEFRDAHTIRVQYATRSAPGRDSSVVDTVDFRKDRQGVFQFHRT
jgi:hypothetical protein